MTNTLDSTPAEFVELPLAETVDDCWNRIGIRGDRSCPELTRVVHCHNCPVFSAAGQRLLARPLPPDSLAERTWDGGKATDGSSVETIALIVFRVGEEWLALDVRQMVEVAETRVVHRIPHRRDRLLRGLVNVRGELQLCYSLAHLLDLDTAAESADPLRSGWLLVAEHNQQRWTVAVDEVLGVSRVDVDQLTPVPVTVAHGRHALSRSVFLLDDKRIGLLDEHRLFEALQQAW